jgi:hypothetical protein
MCTQQSGNSVGPVASVTVVKADKVANLHIDPNLVQPVEYDPFQSIRVLEISCLYSSNFEIHPVQYG